MVAGRDDDHVYPVVRRRDFPLHDRRGRDQLPRRGPRVPGRPDGVVARWGYVGLLPRPGRDHPPDGCERRQRSPAGRPPGDPERRSSDLAAGVVARRDEDRLHEPGSLDDRSGRHRTHTAHSPFGGPGGLRRLLVPGRTPRRGLVGPMVDGRYRRSPDGRRRLCRQHGRIEPHRAYGNRSQRGVAVTAAGRRGPALEPGRLDEPNVVPGRDPDSR